MRKKTASVRLVWTLSKWKSPTFRHFRACIGGQVMRENIFTYWQSVSLVMVGSKWKMLKKIYQIGLMLLPIRSLLVFPQPLNQEGWERKDLRHVKVSKATITLSIFSMTAKKMLCFGVSLRSCERGWREESVKTVQSETMGGWTGLGEQKVKGSRWDRDMTKWHMQIKWRLLKTVFP